MAGFEEGDILFLRLAIMLFFFFKKKKKKKNKKKRKYWVLDF